MSHGKWNSCGLESDLGLRNVRGGRLTEEGCSLKSSCTPTKAQCFPWWRRRRGWGGRVRENVLTQRYMKDTLPKKASWRDGETQSVEVNHTESKPEGTLSRHN